MPWKFAKMRESWLCSWTWGVDFGGLDGDDELSWSGMKGLGLWTVLLVKLELFEFELVSKEERDEKKLELNWGRPHWTQCQETSVPFSAWYTKVFKSMHFLWYQPSQSSHCTAGVFQEQFLEQMRHGYFGVLGPGLDSMSPAARSVMHFMRGVFRLCLHDCIFFLVSLFCSLAAALYDWLVKDL